jgi:tRNA G18 (ribose-2'-O)-methylase SpoU
LSEGVHLWALEQDERAVPITSKWQSDGRRIVMIVGNEVTGVDPDLLDLCERIIYIPMYGIKRSLNVEVAFGVAVSGIQSSCS